MAGDTVLMRNLKLGSTQPNFRPEEFEVIDANGSELEVRSRETGKEYKRNRTHLKKLSSHDSSDVDIQSGLQPLPLDVVDDCREPISNGSHCEQEQTSFEVVQQEEDSRPRRKRNAPGRYRDFHVYQ